MAKKVIQVPVDEELLKNLNTLSKKQCKTRSELIRQACLSYLQRVKDEDMDKIYQLGYKKVPEEPEMGEIQVSISGEFLPRESW